MRGTGIGIMVTALVVGLLAAAPGTAETSTEHYRMISTIEYAGLGQFRNQVETDFTVHKKQLAEGKVRFSLQSENLASPLSFVVDRSAQHVSQVDDSLALAAKASNLSAKALKASVSENIGKTWKEGVKLDSVSAMLPQELRFTLTAMQEETEELGNLVAVRALSEPFVVDTARGPARARVNSLYLFDSSIEDIYLSMSVFETVSVVNGAREVLRHEVATYRTDASGKPVDLSVMSKKFQAMASKVGLAEKSLKVTNSVPLPAWAKAEGLGAAQMAHACSATFCEGALNPVSSVALPTAKVIEMQKVQNPTTENAPLAANEDDDDDDDKGGGALDDLFGNFGWNWQTAGIIGGAVAIPVALSGGGGGGGGGVASPQRVEDEETAE